MTQTTSEIEEEVEEVSKLEDDDTAKKLAQWPEKERANRICWSVY